MSVMINAIDRTFESDLERIKRLERENINLIAENELLKKSKEEVWSLEIYKLKSLSTFIHEMRWKELYSDDDPDTTNYRLDLIDKILSEIEKKWPEVKKYEQD